MANASDKAGSTPADQVANAGQPRDRVAIIDEHLASGIDRASDSAQSAVTAVEERSRAAIEAARRKADDARRTLERLEREAGDRVERTSDDVATLIREKPLQAAGIAFAAGVLTTMILRR